MKKLIWAVLIIFCLLPGQAWAEEIPVFNSAGQKLPLNPGACVENGSAMLPLRAVAEALGAEVVWQATGEVSISKGESRVDLNVGKTAATVTLGIRRESISLTVPPYYQEQTLFVPLRLVAEAFDVPVSYCVNYQDDTKYPAIFLGKSKYAETYAFEDLSQKNESDVLPSQKQQIIFNTDIYDNDEINLIYSVFVGDVLGLYAESVNQPQSFGELSQAINDYYAFYITDEVLSSPEWEQFLALAKHQRREIDIVPLQISVQEDKISGTFGFQLFSGFLFIPLLADVEITLCDDSLKAQVPSNPFSSDKGGLVTDNSGHIWQVTKVGNPRSYINLQALRDNEPEIYASWLSCYK